MRCNWKQNQPHRDHREHRHADPQRNSEARTVIAKLTVHYETTDACGSAFPGLARRNECQAVLFDFQLSGDPAMWKREKPFGQRSEVTSPYVAIIGAVAIVILAIAAISAWPDSETLRTGPTANLPDNQKGSSEAPGSPKGTN